MAKILAIDLGKFKSVTCLLKTETNETEFWTMSTDRQYLLTVLKNYDPDLAQLRQLSFKLQEFCSILSYLIPAWKRGFLL